MRIVNERLFRVLDNSNTYRAIQRYLDAHEATAKAWGDFCNKYGASQYLSADDLQGLMFEHGEQPAGWIVPAHSQHSRAYRPSFRDKACSDAAKEFKALPSKPSMFTWLDMLGIPLKIGDRRAFKTPGFKKINGTYYLTASEGCAVPDDVVDVPNDEAGQLLEAYERQEQEQEQEQAA